MEKSWENFWTTGKVEDYLTYRNRVMMSEREDSQETHATTQNELFSGDTENNKSSWKGFT